MLNVFSKKDVATQLVEEVKGYKGVGARKLRRKIRNAPVTPELKVSLIKALEKKEQALAQEELDAISGNRPVNPLDARLKEVKAKRFEDLKAYVEKVSTQDVNGLVAQVDKFMEEDK